MTTEAATEITVPEANPTPPQADVSMRDDGTAVVAVRGDWLMRSRTPPASLVEDEFDEHGKPMRLEFDTRALGKWDSGLATFALNCLAICETHHVEFRGDTLPDGLQKLIHLARAVPEISDATKAKPHLNAVAKLGERTLRQIQQDRDATAFLGSSVLAFLKMMRGKAQFRWSDAMMAMQQCGPEALGVVALINFLVGVILAFVGAVQLRQFGASIYVADLVAIGAVREMGCIMTGVILCGRTGAAFAAQLGAMKVNEEIDAFKTFAISPIEFLVLPRMLALLLMMPLLCVFADVICLSGGYVVSISMLDVTSTEYISRTIEAITLKSFLLGIFKGAFFGVIVAVSGCLRGIQCGSNAAAVGQATTSAVVTGITAIVAADGVFAVLCNALKI